MKKNDGQKNSHCGTASANGEKNGVCEKPRENLCATAGDTFYNVICIYKSVNTVRE